MSEQQQAVAAALKQPSIDLLLAIADDKFFLGHRNGDWTGLAPFLEEDIAFSNIAQDEIAHAQELYKLAAALADPASDPTVGANQLAYARPANQRRNATLVELADEFDWSMAITRQFLYDHFDAVRLPRLTRSSYRPLAELAGKMLQEITFHIDHFDDWMRRLGQGTPESHGKTRAALELLWAQAGGLFEAVPDQQLLVEAGIYPGSDDDMLQQWCSATAQVIESAGLQVPAPPTPATAGGRKGRHSDCLQPLLDELAEVFSDEPDAVW